MLPATQAKYMLSLSSLVCRAARRSASQHSRKKTAASPLGEQRGMSWARPTQVSFKSQSSPTRHFSSEVTYSMPLRAGRAGEMEVSANQPELMTSDERQGDDWSAPPRIGILDRMRCILTNTPPQRTLNSAYTLKEVLGTGRFGVVRKGVDKETGREVAVKSIEKRAVKDESSLVREVEILSMIRKKQDAEIFHMMSQQDTLSLGSSTCSALDLKHIQEELRTGGLMNLIEAFEEKEYLHIISDIYTGGELFDRIVDRGANQYRESDAAKIFIQILLSIRALHNKGVTHRDLKPENICFEDESQDSPVVIVDFGHACLFPGKDCQGQTKKLSEQTGSILYVAPEVLDGAYTETADIWSAGVILFVLLTGAPPFNHSTQAGIEAQIRQGIYGEDPDDGWHFISDDAKQLCASLLNVDPENRISLDDAINHPWFDVIEASKSGEEILPVEIIQSLRRFSCSNQLKRKACRILARQIMKSSESQHEYMKPLRHMFDQLDRDGDGMVSIQELGSGFKELGVANTVSQLESLTTSMDDDQDGVVSFEEFVAAAAEHDILRSQVFAASGHLTLRTVFDTFCEGSSNKISQSTLYEIYSGDVTELERTLQEFDVNGDGWLDFDEFCMLMESGNSPLNEVTEEEILPVP